MKIVFLDVDGVLNTHNQTWIDMFSIDISRVKILQDIVCRTGAKIVLHSSWRLDFLFLQWITSTLLKQNLSIFSQTKDFNDKEKEISEWIKQNSCEHFVVIDDWPIWSGENFFKTDPKIGLTKEMAEKIINFLGEKNV